MLQQREEKRLVKPWNFNIKTEQKTHILSSVHQVFCRTLWDDVGGYFWERLAAILLQRSLVRGDSQWETLGNGDNCACADQRNKKMTKKLFKMLLYVVRCCLLTAWTHTCIRAVEEVGDRGCGSHCKVMNDSAIYHTAGLSWPLHEPGRERERERGRDAESVREEEKRWLGGGFSSIL